MTMIRRIISGLRRKRRAISTSPTPSSTRRSTRRSTGRRNDRDSSIGDDPIVSTLGSAVVRCRFVSPLASIMTACRSGSPPTRRGPWSSRCGSWRNTRSNDPGTVDCGPYRLGACRRRREARRSGGTQGILSRGHPCFDGPAPDCRGRMATTMVASRRRHRGCRTLREGHRRPRASLGPSSEWPWPPARRGASSGPA